MRANRYTLAKLCLLAALAVPAQRAASATVSQGTPQANAVQLLAQGNAGSEFTLPAALDDAETLLIDGSSSMRTMNAALTAQFQERYENAAVEAEANGSDVAVDRLLDGAIDLAAIGRPLTEAEQDAGLSAVAIAREKIAIIVGPENPFDGDITFAQFGQIFRGEITDWSELGGEPGPIRFVDRPEFSDTRQAFRPYPVFQEAEFVTGFTADPVFEDETDAVVDALGSDGIGYAIANQVMSSDDVKIISMHQTLPDDPAYPFSQPRNYVYLGEPSEAAQGFLGVATGAAGQAAVENVRDAEEAAAVEIEGERPTVTSSDGTLTASTDEDNVAFIENDLGEAVTGPLLGAGGAVTALAFSEDGQTLATGTNTGNVRYWDVDSGTPTDEAFAAGNGKAITDLSFDGNDKLVVSTAGGQRGNWGLNGLPFGETAAGAAAGDAVAGAAGSGEAAAGSLSPWLWLLPLLGLLGVGLWAILGRKKSGGQAEAIRQTAPTATVPPPATDPETDREVSNRAQSVISTDRVTDDSRVVAPGENAAVSATAATAPLPVGLPGIDAGAASDAPDAGETNLPLYESTDLESPDLEGTNLDLLTPTGALGGAAAVAGGAAIGGMMMGLDAGVETDDDDDEWDDNLDLTLDDTPLDESLQAVPTADTSTAEISTADISTTDASAPDIAAQREPVVTDIDNLEPTRGTVIAETETILDIEPTRETIIGDSAVIFGEAAATDEAASSGIPSESSAPVAAMPSVAAGIVGTAAVGLGAAATSVSTTAADEGSSSSTTIQYDPSITNTSTNTPMEEVSPSLSIEELATVDDGLPDLPEGYGESRIVLLPRDPKWAYAYWDVSNEHKQELRQQGGQRLMLRLYDVTDIDQSVQAPHSMQQQDCHEMARSWYLEVPVSDRDYSAEIGYLTADDRWLLLARSAPIRVPPIYPSDWVKDQFVTIGFDEGLAGRTFGDLGQPYSPETPSSDSEAENLPKIYDDLFAMTQGQEALRVAGSLYGSMQHAAPGALSASGNVSGQPGFVPNASGLNVSGLNMSGVGPALPGRVRNFWLVADAELIVYGATEPSATLTVGDRVVPLNPDGTFRFHVSFPDGQIDYPIRAVAADGEQTRSIHLHFERETPERNTNTKADAKDEWF